MNAIVAFSAVGSIGYVFSVCFAYRLYKNMKEEKLVRRGVRGNPRGSWADERARGMMLRALFES